MIKIAFFSDCPPPLSMLFQILEAPYIDFFIGTMNNTQCLQFLRPYVYQRLPVKKQAYLRLYDDARQRAAAFRPAQRCLGTASDRQAVDSDDGEGKDAIKIRSHAVATRIEELSQAKALVYPRIRNGAAMPMRIPTFREKYCHVSKESPGQEEVVLHGT
jgi:lysyl-tRNA synthetase class 2